MKIALRFGMVFALLSLLAGCWIAHTSYDRPELRANVGRDAVLTEAYGLFRARGGRLYLKKEAVSSDYTLVEKLPPGTGIRIKDVIYRISDPGRHDYYIVEIATSSGPLSVEVLADKGYRLPWRYEEKG